MKDHWLQFGMREHQKIEVFDSSRPGIEYVLKEEGHSQERIVEMSQALRAFIKKIQRTELSQRSAEKERAAA